MSPLDIKVGTTYYNRGAGKTQRTVVDIGTHIKPPYWLSDSEAPSEESRVLYTQKNEKRVLFLSSFAQWAGGVAPK